jgi:hypothetical protein
MSFRNYYNTIKRNLTLLLALFPLFHVTHSQSLENPGKPIVEIFTDLHVNLNDTSKTSGFGLNRAYFGYKFFPVNNFSATVILNIGTPEDLPLASVHRRYAYFREASVSYEKESLRISFGITSTRYFNYQQKFWGKRYIANTFQALNGYGIVADLGVVVDYKFSDLISGDITVMNGEGYSELQLDNGVKTSAGFTMTPSKQLSVRFYSDVTKQNGIWQSTFMSFAGFRNDLFTIGAEVNYKTNIDLEDGHNAWGISGTGTLSLSEKYEIFTRYDYSASVTASYDTNYWNYLLDGNLFIAGLQYIFNPNVKIAFDYQEKIPYDTDLPSTSMIFINASFKF